MALAWLGVVNAGLVAVATMPLLRAKELGEVIEKSQIALALCDATLLDELEIAKKQMSGFGGMVSFTFVSGKKEDAIDFLEKVKVFTLAESLGGVESLANHPALMTHASIPEEKRKEIGITDDLVRLSVGIEDAEDLIADLKQALA